MNAPILSFSGGEQTPLVDTRHDLEKYHSGCRTMLNMIPRIYGCSERRPGAEWIQNAKNSPSGCRMIPFIYSATIAYMLEFGEDYIRVFYDGEALDDGVGNQVEVVSPYALADVNRIHYAQIGDTLWLVHPDYQPRKFQRTSSTTFTLTAIDFDKGPFQKRNDLANADSVTMTSSVTTGSGTLTASSSTFTANHVGARFKLVHPRTTTTVTQSGAGTSSTISVLGTATWTTRGTWTGTAKLERNENSGGWETYRVQTSTDDANIQFSWTEKEEDVLYRITIVAGVTGTCNSDINVHASTQEGIVKVTAYTSGTVVSITVLETVAAVTSTTRWAEGSWSDDAGWPGAITFFDNRAVYAGTDTEPQTIWLSEVDDYEDFRAGTDSSDSFGVPMQSTNRIIGLASLEALAIFTTGDEWRLQSNKLDTPITPTNFSLKKQTEYGTSDVQPVTIGPVVMFLDDVARKMREFTWSEGVAKYVAPDLTALAEHITKSGIVSFAYQKNPDSILWGVRDDGTLVSMVYDREQNVIAWSRHIIAATGDPEEDVDPAVADSGDTGAVSALGQFLLANYSASSSWLAAGIDEDGTVVDTVDDIDANDTYVRQIYISPYTGKFYILNTSSGHDCGYYTFSIFTASSVGTVAIGDTVTGSVGSGTYLVHDIIYDDGSQNERGTMVVTITSGPEPVNLEVLSKDGSNYVTVYSYTGGEYGVIKYNADGTLDTTWGNGGYKVNSSESFPLTCVIEDSDGNTYFGSSSNASAYMTVFSLDVDGLFRWGATYNSSTRTYPSQVYSLALSQNEATLFVAHNDTSLGGVGGTTTTFMAMALTASSGARNTGWGTSGRLMRGSTFPANIDFYSVVRDPTSDALFVACTSFDAGAGTYYSVAKITAAGAVDTTWGTSGLAGDDLRYTGDYVTRDTHAMQVDEYGYLFFMGYAYPAGVEDQQDTKVIYYNSSGVEIDSFTIAATVDRSEVCLYVKDDYVYVGGKSRTRGAVDSTVIRYEYDGTLDTSYTPASLAAAAAYSNEITQIVDFDTVYYSNIDLDSYIGTNARVDSDSWVSSVAVAPGDEEDEVWLSALVPIGDGYKHFILRFKPRDWGTDTDDMFFVDCGKTVTNSPASVTISGLSHLEGETVTVLGDGVQYTPTGVVSGGSVTIGTAVTTAQVGLPYRYVLKPNRPLFTDNKGTILGSKVRAAELAVSFYRSLAAKYGIDTDTLYEFFGEDGLTVAAEWENNTDITGLFTGEIVVSHDGGYSRDNDIVISDNGVYPCIIRAITVRMERSGR